MTQFVWRSGKRERTGLKKGMSVIYLEELCRSDLTMRRETGDGFREEHWGSSGAAYGEDGVENDNENRQGEDRECDQASLGPLDFRLPQQI